MKPTSGNINWGILGLGKIAHKFAADLLLSNDAILYGVASRDLEKAKVFSQQYHTRKFFGSYEEMMDDPEIQVVYIATPHPYHFGNTMMCLDKGKAVLCEKPLGMNAGEVRAMIAKAWEKQLFLMEGMWTRFIPGTVKYLELLQEQAIGEVTALQADFGFRAEYDADSRIFNKALGGGSLLDIGIYPIYLSLITLGIPTSIQATARMTDTHVDSYCSMHFNYRHSARAVLESTFEADTPTEATLSGTHGIIKLHHRFHHTETISLQQGNTSREFKIPYRGNGYFHEIEEVNRCLLAGKKESPELPWRASLDLIAIIDRVRKKIGLSY